VAKYLLVFYGGGMPDTPTESDKVMKAWNSWMGTLGPALVDGGNPAGAAKTVAANGKFIDPNDPLSDAFFTTDDNTMTDQAVELLQVNPGTYQIVIAKVNDGPARRIKYVDVNGAGESDRENAPSIWGHTAARRGQSVGAMFYGITNFPEDYSSPGPVTILFDRKGRRLEHAVHILAHHCAKIPLAEWNMRHDFCLPCLHRFGDGLLLCRIGFASKIVPQLLDCLVAGPAEHRLVAGGVHEAGKDRIGDVDRDPRGEEGMPAAGIRRVLFGTARDQGLPVHGLHVDLETGLLHERFRHRGQVGEHG